MGANGNRRENRRLAVIKVIIIVFALGETEADHRAWQVSKRVDHSPRELREVDHIGFYGRNSRSQLEEPLLETIQYVDGVSFVFEDKLH
ncbi:hypothetical protein F5Y08DRAFT_334781 [Xylaria arbuscula]|nr:hypothetical protein F5Y08DRAFT_334781 [Xylaria arbuscula]